jgi:hypothetical protein
MAASNPITEYLRGNTSSNDCEALFKNYKGCLNVSPALCYAKYLYTSRIVQYV